MRQGQVKSVDIRINQGADFTAIILIEGMNGPIDVTGYEFLGEIKHSTAHCAPTIGEFSFTVLDQVLTTGQVQWSLPASQAEEIMPSVANALNRRRQSTPFLYDVKMKDTSGSITRILQGTAFVSPEVTEEEFT